MKALRTAPSKVTVAASLSGKLDEQRIVGGNAARARLGNGTSTDSQRIPSECQERSQVEAPKDSCAGSTPWRTHPNDVASSTP